MPETLPWELEGFEKRIEATGWPEWEQDGTTYRLERIAHFNWMRTTGRADVFLTDHEAACLIRDHWMVWLRKRGYDIQWVGENAYEVHGPKGYIGTFDSYDQAQAVAVDDVIAEENSDGSDGNV